MMPTGVIRHIDIYIYIYIYIGSTYKCTAPFAIINNWLYYVATEYREYQDSDMPRRGDYHCRYTVASSGCMVSVFDRREAEDMCDAERDCRAFVLSSNRTWTGG